MFVVLLKFGENKSRAGQLMEGHNAWIKQGFDDGVFLLVGSLEIGQGGAILAHNASLQELEERVSLDPFVEEGVVNMEILQISSKKAVEQLSFLTS